MHCPRFDQGAASGPLWRQRATRQAHCQFIATESPTMITKFDSLFAGHVDMADVGYGGIPVNERRFPNENLATVFDKAQGRAQLMDRFGYDSFWMAEHHFQREGYECIPNVLMTALHLAHLTRRIRIG